jgi:transposase
MAAIVYQTNKKSGVTYAYTSVSYWDPDKQQSRARRHCIGRVDPATNTIVPTRKRSATAATQPSQKGSAKTPYASRRFYGATYLFDRIGAHIGVSADLQSCFPDRYRQILSIAYYLILEHKNPLSRFPRWAAIHRHPYGDIISSQRSSELFASITEDAVQRFFHLQGTRRMEKEYLSYDSTSISSYSQCLRQVRYGNNKDHEHLPQINLSMLFGQESSLPFYYRTLAGNIPDVKTLRNMLADMQRLGYKKIKVVLDRGFYSAENINALYTHHIKFLIATKVSLKMVKTHIETVREKMRSWTHYNQDYQLYMYTVPVSWDYVTQRPYKGDTLHGQRRMYLHLYYSPERAVEDEKAFNNKLSAWQDELRSGTPHPDHEKQYAAYFEVKSTPVRGIKVIPREEAIAAATRNYGYFALLSNEIKEPLRALQVYRNKDMVEKAFDNLKERLNLRRVAVSSEQSLDGKLFVQFIALIYVSYITQKMQHHHLFKQYTLQDVLDELDLIECFEASGKKLRVGETTKRQMELYTKLGVTPPTSLQ